MFSTNMKLKDTNTTFNSPIEFEPNGQEEKECENEGEGESDGEKDKSVLRTSNNYNPLRDSNEAQENIQSPILIDPEQTYLANSNGNNITDSNDEIIIGDDQMSRRVFLGHNLASSLLLSDEMRKLRKQRTKLFSNSHLKRKKLRRKKKNQKKSMIKSTQTRQEFNKNTNDNLNLQSILTPIPAHIPVPVPSSNQISTTIRQHFPTRANSLQFTSAVQKLIMNNLSKHKQTNRHKELQQAMNYQQLAPNSLLSLRHTGALLAQNPQLSELLNQWDSSEKSPTYSPSDLEHHNNKIIPVEVIGLDPAVTSSILYGPNEDAFKAAASVLKTDSSQAYQANRGRPSSSIHQPKLAGQSVQSFQTIRSQRTASKVKERPGPQSILHIHHFHTRGNPESIMPQQQAAQGIVSDTFGSAGEDKHEVFISTGGASNQQEETPANQENYQMNSMQSLRQGSLAAQGVIQQQVFLNEQGELVHLPVMEDQSNSGFNWTLSKNGDQLELQGKLHPQLESVYANQKTRLTNNDLTQQHQVTETPNNLQAQREHQQVTIEESTASSTDKLMDDTKQENVNLQHEHTISNSSQQLSAGLNSEALDLVNQSPGDQHFFPISNQSFKPDQHHPVSISLTNTGQTISATGQMLPQLNGETENDDEQQLLMVSYKPQPQQEQHDNKNLTEISLMGYRTPYNEGQESKFSQILASHHLANSSQLLNNTNILSKPFDLKPNNHTLQQVGLILGDLASFRPQPKINISELKRINLNKSIQAPEMTAHHVHGEPVETSRIFSIKNNILNDNQISLIKAKLSSPLLKQVPAMIQLQDNRVPSTNLTPFANPALKPQTIPIDENSHSLNGSRNELSTIHSLWPKSLAGEGGKLLHLESYETNQNNLHPQQDLIENLALLKHLQQINTNNKLQQKYIPSLQARINNQMLNNSTKLSNEELSRILYEFKMNNSYPINVSLTNSSLRSVTTRPIMSEMTQASDRSSAKYMRSQMNNNANNITQDGSNQINGKVSGSLKKDHKLNNNMMVHSSNRNELQHHVKQQPVDSEESDFSDTNGLSNIALAFIFIVSLITLTIIAASMIYRQRRRSIGRCADLPARSRLNLTKRTKHFLRSNFVSPSDVTSIKSINLDTSNSHLVEDKSQVNRSSIGAKNSTVGIDNSIAIDRYINKKTFGQPLSTFNSTPLAEKYQCTEESADIKTLNTRLQRPSYLKSLISTSGCLLPQGKKQDYQADFSSASCYLNIRHRSPAIKHIKSTSPNRDSSCKRSHSFKKLKSNFQQSYSSSLRGAVHLRNEPSRSGDTKHSSESKNYSNRILTKHSISDCNKKTSSANCGTSSQMTKQINVVCRASKPGNSPASKHIVTIGSVNHDCLEDRSKPPDSTQTDRL